MTLLTLRIIAVASVIVMAASATIALNLVSMKTADRIMTWIFCPALGLLIGVTLVAWLTL